MWTLKEYLFRIHLNPHFVETGTNLGAGIQLALQCGYGRIFSMERDAETCRTAHVLFAEDKRVTILHGDSSQELNKVIRQINYPATFWLDAHDPEKGECAILGELDAIAKDPIKNHTIMIDDWEDFGTPKHGNIAKEAVIDALRRINPDYRIACHYAEPGAPNILVAEL